MPHTLLTLSWRVYPAALLMLLGVGMALRAFPWRLAGKPLLQRVLAYWRASIWLALAAIGAGWWLGSGWLAGIGLGYFIAEGWESGMVIGGLNMRRDDRRARG